MWGARASMGSTGTPLPASPTLHAVCCCPNPLTEGRAGVWAVWWGLCARGDLRWAPPLSPPALYGAGRRRVPVCCLALVGVCVPALRGWDVPHLGVSRDW